MKLQEFDKILPSTLIYELILINISMNVNIMKKKFRSHYRSQKVILKFKKKSSAIYKINYNPKCYPRS